MLLPFGTMLLTLLLTVAILAFFALRYDPNRLHGRLLRRLMTGFALLLCWNLFSGHHLGVNPLSMLTAGCLGAPGLGLLAVMAMLP